MVCHDVQDWYVFLYQSVNLWGHCNWHISSTYLLKYFMSLVWMILLFFNRIYLIRHVWMISSSSFNVNLTWYVHPYLTYPIQLVNIISVPSLFVFIVTTWLQYFFISLDRPQIYEFDQRITKLSKHIWAVNQWCRLLPLIGNVYVLVSLWLFPPPKVWPWDNVNPTANDENLK